MVLTNGMVAEAVLDSQKNLRKVRLQRLTAKESLIGKGLNRMECAFAKMIRGWRGSSIRATLLEALWVMLSTHIVAHNYLSDSETIKYVILDNP